MFELGMAVAFVLGLVALLWYRQAASRFSQRIVGYDMTRPPEDMRWLWREGPRDSSRILAAWRVPSADPETEHWRILMRRRFGLFAVVGAPLVFGLPTLFGLVGLDWQALVKGPVGFLLFLFLVGMLARSLFRIAQPLVAYGSGLPLDARRVAGELAGLAVTLVVAVWIVMIFAP